MLAIAASRWWFLSHLLFAPVSHLRSVEQLTRGLGAHNRTETFRKQLRAGVHRFPPSLSRISCRPAAARDRRQRPVTNYILLAQSRPRVHLRAPSRPVPSLWPASNCPASDQKLLLGLPRLTESSFVLSFFLPFSPRSSFSFSSSLADCSVGWLVGRSFSSRSGYLEFWGYSPTACKPWNTLPCPLVYVEVRRT